MESGDILDALVGGDLLSSGGSMLSKIYNINGDITTYSVEQWAELHDRSEKAKWFIGHYEEIKEKFQDVINGQVKFRQFQGWLYQQGFKGASKIKEAEVKALIAENDHLESGKQQDYLLEKERERATAETAEFNRGTDAQIKASIDAYKAKIDNEIAQLEGNPQFQAAIEEWKKSKSQNLAWATTALKGGKHGLAHPKFVNNQPASIGGSGKSAGWTWGAAQRATDSVNRGFARAANNIASSIGHGLGRLGQFFGIGAKS